MGYISKYLCKELCDATNATLNNFYDTDRIMDLIIYTFLFAKACYASVRESGFVTDVTFEMFYYDGITVQIDSMGEKICGYINGQQAYFTELNPDIATTLYDMGVKYYEHLLDKDTLVMVNEYQCGEITFDLLAL